MVCIDIGLILVLHQFQCFFGKRPSNFHLHVKLGKIETISNLLSYSHISIDAKFNAESEFEIEIVITPTYFCKMAISKIYVGKSQKIFTSLEN